MPSNTKFGLFFSFLILLFVFFLFKNKSVIHYELIFSSILLIFVSILKPCYLSPLNKFWFQLGLLLNKIFSPFILGILFFLIITPCSFILRLKKRDVLNLKKSPAPSYWIDRNKNEFTSESFKNQF
jgi:hypothetical protein